MTPEPAPDAESFPSLRPWAEPIVAWLEANVGPVPVANRWKYLQSQAFGVIVKAWLYDDPAGGYVEWRVGWGEACCRVGLTRFGTGADKIPAAVLVAAECVRLARLLDPGF